MPSFTYIVRSLRDTSPVLLNTTGSGSYLENVRRRRRRRRRETDRGRGNEYIM